MKPFKRIALTLINYILAIFLYVFNFRVFTLGVLKKTRKNDSLLILGSGYSINDISIEDWNIFENRYDKFSFNKFHLYKNLEVDYYMFEGTLDKSLHSAIVENIVNTFRNKPTVVIFKFLPWIRRYGIGYTFRLYRRLQSLGVNVWWSFMLWSFSTKNNGLVKMESKFLFKQSNGTISYLLNMAYKAGYRSVVMAGIDVYGPYFWQPEQAVNDQIFNSHKGVVSLFQVMEFYQNLFESRGGSLKLISERSALSKVLTTYKGQQ